MWDSEPEGAAESRSATAEPEGVTMLNFSTGKRSLKSGEAPKTWSSIYLSLHLQYSQDTNEAMTRTIVSADF